MGLIVAVPLEGCGVIGTGARSQAERAAKEARTAILFFMGLNIACVGAWIQVISGKQYQRFCLPTLSSLTLTAYRSYAGLALPLSSGLVAFSGPNGAGKTNILEAVSLLAPGRGLRRAKLSELSQIDASQPWAIRAVLSDGMAVATGADPAFPEADRRVVLIEGQRSTQAELAEQLSVVWLTPAQDSLWRDSPGTRRRFFDQLVTALHPAHAAHLSRYEEALAERNRLLKDGLLDARWLASLEHILATEGMAVASGRHELVNALNATMHDDALFPQPHLSLTGVENWLDEGPALLAEDRLRDELARNRTLDTAAGLTTLGPHRSDLIALYPAKNMPAHLASTGEQKALLISLVLAHAELIRASTGRSPVLLLDEVAAHLDEERRNTLYSRLFSGGGQALLTGADPTLFSGLLGRVLCYKIASGQVREMVPA
jgi:DNA replication and repair protein RecF